MSRPDGMPVLYHTKVRVLSAPVPTESGVGRAAELQYKKNEVECQIRVTISQIFHRVQNQALADEYGNFLLDFPLQILYFMLEIS